VSSENPYAPSGSFEAIARQNPSDQLRLASQNQRLLTFIIDNVILYLINSGIGFAIGLIFVAMNGGSITQGELAGLQLFASLVGVLLVVVYYVVLEGLTGMTLGKMVMGTKVVNESGGSPSFGQILGRSFCRLIPFEVFSFLGNKGFPIGWHDSIPKTRVIKTR